MTGAGCTTDMADSSWEALVTESSVSPLRDPAVPAVIEFATSLGVSTLYLTTAVRTTAAAPSPSGEAAGSSKPVLKI